MFTHLKTNQWHFIWSLLVPKILRKYYSILINKLNILIIYSLYRKTHKICIIDKSSALLDLVKNNLLPGHRVYVTGKLSTSKFNTIAGKNRTKSAIIASEICIFDDSALDKNNEIDENSVELTGTIMTPNTSNATKSFKSFTLASLK